MIINNPIKAFVIYIEDNQYSIDMANRCVQSGIANDVYVEKFSGVTKVNAIHTMRSFNLEWTWAHDNTIPRICSKTNLYQFPYTTSDLRTKIGCSMSHYLLWKKCVELAESILILEHDTVFMRHLPYIAFNGICQINDPDGVTRKGNWWSNHMKDRKQHGIFPKTKIPSSGNKNVPDGLAGNSAYLIKPWAAKALIDKCHEIGLWPNDAIMCRQLFPFLEEYYPFITKSVQTKSTSTGY